MLSICFIMIYKALLVRKREASPLPISLENITRTEGPLKYQYTQKLGKWAKENGYDGILAPSARHNGGSNIVILKK